MLGEFITKGLVLVLGYAYPAFECFKTMEKNKVEKAELQFWCQYWVILAVLTVFEGIGAIFISWYAVLTLATRRLIHIYFAFHRYEEARRRRSCVVSGRISVTWLPRMRRRGNGKCRKRMENRRKRISSSRT
ncbi:hypothetical protein CsSME_00043612 [Camellia sinensis var. sinensis]